jgi:predicted small metal-binding protein
MSLGYLATCPCGFVLRNANEDEYVKLVQTHARMTHRQEIDRASVLKLAERVSATGPLQVTA